jgi:hypothetical protein
LIPSAAGEGRARGERIDRAVDDIRRKYGAGAITFGNILCNDIGVELDEHENEVEMFDV